MTKAEIAQIRRWFDWTQAQMGAKIGANLTTVCDMERGRRGPTGQQLAKLVNLRARMLKEMRQKVAVQ